MDGHSPGLPAAELAGPSTTEKLERRTEGRGSACTRRLVCTSLYTDASRPGAGPFATAAPPLDVTAAAAMCPRVWRSERAECVSLIWFGVGGERICRGRSERVRRRRGGFYGSWRRVRERGRWVGGLFCGRAPGFVPCRRFGPGGAGGRRSGRGDWRADCFGGFTARHLNLGIFGY